MNVCVHFLFLNDDMRTIPFRCQTAERRVGAPARSRARGTSPAPRPTSTRPRYGRLPRTTPGGTTTPRQQEVSRQVLLRLNGVGGFYKLVERKLCIFINECMSDAIELQNSEMPLFASNYCFPLEDEQI